MSGDVRVTKLIEGLNGKVQNNHYEDLIEDDDIYELCGSLDIVIGVEDISGDYYAHRWYEEDTVVYKVVDELNCVIGYIRGNMVTKLYSEQSMISDIHHIMKFVEVEPYEEVKGVIQYKDVI